MSPTMTNSCAWGRHTSPWRSKGAVSFTTCGRFSLLLAKGDAHSTCIRKKVYIFSDTRIKSPGRFFRFRKYVHYFASAQTNSFAA
jgi:hypothetical protein